MIKVTVLYGHPANAAAFERYYNEVHLPIASKMSGFTKFEFTVFGPGPDGSKPAYHRMAEFWFESEAALQGTLTSEAGQATMADIPNFADGGATFIFGQVVG